MFDDQANYTIVWDIYGDFQGTNFYVFLIKPRTWPVNSPHKGPVTKKMFPFEDVIMNASWRPTARSGHESTPKPGKAEG